MQARTLPRRFKPWSLGVFLFALAWGLAALTAFMLMDDTLAATGLVALGVPVFLYGIQRSAAEQRNLICPSCEVPLPPPLENGPGSGEPIIYHCHGCAILWFAGLTRPD